MLDKLLAGMLALCMSGCSKGLTGGPVAVSKLSSHVLVVVNAANRDSVAIGLYYVHARGIPPKNLLFARVRDNEEVSASDYFDLQRQVQNAIRTLNGSIDYIVLTKHVPLKILPNRYSVDGHLAAMEKSIPEIKRPDRTSILASANPYFGKNATFSHVSTGLYLVTRLDGYTATDAERLVDNSVRAKNESGPFFLHGAANRTKESYGEVQEVLARAGDILQSKGYEATYDAKPGFLPPSAPVEGYASWGSNDGNFDIESYRKIRFLPGAIAETFVSTSGRTFLPAKGGQSLIADLIHQGVTGVKGYVDEPFTFSMAHVDILFDRYTSGFNLAESFYMASPIINYKDVIVGDPLCAPYADHF